MLPVLAGYIAMAIGDRPALAVGFVGGMIAAGGKSGFLGALVAGFAAGYIIVGLKKVCGKLPEAVEKIAPVLLYLDHGITDDVCGRTGYGRHQHRFECGTFQHERNEQDPSRNDRRRNDVDRYGRSV